MSNCGSSIMAAGPSSASAAEVETADTPLLWKEWGK